MILDRNILIEIRDSARGQIIDDLNPDWADAYRALAVAADHLDAMTARITLVADKEAT